MVAVQGGGAPCVLDRVGASSSLHIQAQVLHFELAAVEHAESPLSIIFLFHIFKLKILEARP